MNNYIIKISAKAYLTLYENIFFLLSFSIPYAQKVKKQMLKEINNLTTFPNINPIFKKTYKNLYRKLIVNNRYLVIYTVKKDN